MSKVRKVIDINKLLMDVDPDVADCRNCRYWTLESALPVKFIRKYGHSMGVCKWTQGPVFVELACASFKRISAHQRIDREEKAHEEASEI